MNVDTLKELKNKHPFTPFTLHMNDGSQIKVDDRESLVIPKGWTTDAFVFYPDGRFSFVYLRNIAHIAGSGGMPKFGRRRRKDRDDEN